MGGLTVLIPTFNRQEILYGTVQRLHYHLKYTGGDLKILVGDDSDDIGMAAKYMEHLRDDLGTDVEVLDGPRRGLGANLNMLLQAAETEVVMQMDDDHYLQYVIDVTEYVDEIENDKAFGWIRLFLGEDEDSNNKETYYKFTGKTYGKYWRLIPNAGELYIPSNRPHIKTKQFHDVYGLYDEDVKLGVQETLFCHRYADAWVDDGLLDVFIPMYPPGIDAWKHVGESWQQHGH
jgi:glycosyltransferase involved in cell wall biosynthesis